MTSKMTNISEKLPKHTLKDAGIYLLNDVDMTAESQRLDVQHSILMRVNQGALLPPHVLHHLTDVAAANAAEDRSDPRSVAVADVATGTGVWLRDLAKLLPPDVRLDGFDHDSSKFPLSASPMNLQLHKQDILNSFPQEYRGIYDVVHVRLLAYVLRADQWQPLIEHLASELLRPGGWLVWEEPVIHASMGVPLTPHWAKRQLLLGQLEKADGRDPIATIRLVGRFRKAGLLDCTAKYQHSLALEDDPDLPQDQLRMMMLGTGPFFKSMLRRLSLEGLRTEDDVDELTRGLQQEMELGECRYNSEWAVVAGRKPL